MEITILIISIIILAAIGYTVYRNRQQAKGQNHHYLKKDSDIDLTAKELTPENFTLMYNKQKGLVKGGSLCFFGHWFGKPYDNYHQLKSVIFDNLTKTLTLTFNEKETLTIFNPQHISERENKLTIQSADEIKWKWYYYGRPQTENNLYFIEITKRNVELTVNSNIDWYKPDYKDLSTVNHAVLWASY